MYYIHTCDFQFTLFQCSGVIVRHYEEIRNCLKELVLRYVFDTGSLQEYMDSERSEITKVLNLGKHVHLSLYVWVSVNCTFVCTCGVYVVWVVPDCNSTPGVPRSVSETRYKRNLICFDSERHRLAYPHHLASTTLCVLSMYLKLIHVLLL